MPLYRTYLLKVLTFSLLACASGLSLSYFSTKLQNFSGIDVLLQYQNTKAISARHIETVFIGDSTLGNAINAAYFTELTGSAALNLALTDSLGIAPGFNYLRQVAENNVLKNVVVMYTPLIYGHSESLRGYFLTLNGATVMADLKELKKEAVFNGFSEVLFTVRLSLLWDYLKSILPWRSLKHEPDHLAKLQTIDYIPQGPVSAMLSEDMLTPIRNPFNRERFHFIRKIVQFCADRGINLLYVHAPLASQWLPLTKNSIEKLNVELHHSGVEAIINSAAIESEALGDEYGHVRSDFKNEFTRRYADLLKNYLQ